MNRKILGLVSGVAIASLLAGSITLSQAAGPAGMKLYVFSSGGLTIAKSALQAGASSNPITVPVGFFVVKHPKGNFLFDTGNNDKIISDPSYWGPFIKGLTPERGPDVAIDTQLKKIGLTPDDIKYVAVGHMHLDHGGNVCKFPKATFARPEGRDEERGLARARHRRPLHSRRRRAACGTTSASRSRTSSRWSSWRATWTCSATAAS